VRQFASTALNNSCVKKGPTKINTTKYTTKLGEWASRTSYIMCAQPVCTKEEEDEKMEESMGRRRVRVCRGMQRILNRIEKTDIYLLIG